MNEGKREEGNGGGTGRRENTLVGGRFRWTETEEENDTQLCPHSLKEIHL